MLFRQALLIFLVSISLYAISGDGRELSLSETLKIAMERNLDIQIEQLNLKTQNISLSRTRAIYEPTITSYMQKTSADNEATTGIEGDSGDSFTATNAEINTTFEKSEDFGMTWQVESRNRVFDRGDRSSLGEVYTSFLVLSFDQELLEGFSLSPSILRYDQYIARANVEISEIDLELAITQVLEDAENAYWELLVARDNLAFRQEGLKLAQDLYKLNKTKVDAGNMAEVDLLISESTVAERQADLIIADNTVRAAEDQLKRILNLPVEEWDEAIIPTDGFPSEQPTPNFSRDLADALKTRPEVRQIALDMDNAELSLKYQKNRLLPSLSIGGRYQGYGVDAPTSENDAKFNEAFNEAVGFDLPGWQVRLNLSWQPFNKQAKLDLAQARVDMRGVELAKKRLELQIAEEVKSAGRELQASTRTLEARRQSVAIQRKTLDVETRKFDRGLSTIFQLSELQNNLAEAEADLNVAKARYLRGVVTYYRALGVLAGKRGVQVQ